jgi:hypothetical protein
MLGRARCSFRKKCTRTHDIELVFLHLVGSACHVVNSGVSRPRHIDALFFMLWWAWGGFHEKRTGTRYVELVFLHPVGCVGHVVNCGASGL